MRRTRWRRWRSRAQKRREWVLQEINRRTRATMLDNGRGTYMARVICKESPVFSTMVAKARQLGVRSCTSGAFIQETMAYPEVV